MTFVLRASPIAAILVLILAPPVQAQDQGSKETRSTLDGVYTGEQAQTGRNLFDTQCGLCHTPAEFSGQIFQISWRNRPVGALFSQIRGAMPLDNPGSLTAEEYAAVIAYILQLNSYPTGERPLPTQADSLSRIQFEPVPDGRR